MTRLSPQAKSALDSLQEKHLAYTIAKTTIESELKREANNRLSSIRHERDMALRLASDSGVPKTQLGKAIGTSNYRTVQEILAETEGVIKSTSIDAFNKGNLLVERDPSSHNLYKLSIINFGENSMTGTATIEHNDQDETVFIAGDAFVLPQIYRAGFEEVMLQNIANL